MSVIENIRAEIVTALVAGGYSHSSDILEHIGGAEVFILGDAALVVYRGSRGRADFFYRQPRAGWWYRHSYATPRRPSDAGRYLRHGMKCMKQVCPDWGNWECEGGADV